MDEKNLCQYELTNDVRGPTMSKEIEKFEASGKRLRGRSLAALAALAMAAMALVWVSAGSAQRAEAQEETSGQLAQETRNIGGVEYPVNENGQTYGSVAFSSDGVGPVEDLEISPDLIAVVVTDEGTGESFTGYLTQEDYQYDPSNYISNPEEALAWMDAGCPRERKPIYASDGETIVGWWDSTEDGGVVHGVAV